VKPVPEIVAELIVAAAVPVEDKVTDCEEDAFTAMLPKLMLDELRPSVGTAAFNCNAKVLVALPALAVRVTDCVVLTEVTVAEKFAVVAPEATVTEAGTVTAELLLVRLMAKPPLAAATLIDTVQESVPAPVMDEFVQESPVSAGTPVPLRLTTVGDPVDELLANDN